MTRIAIRQLDHGKDLPLPAYATDHSAGMDLLAAVEGDVILAPGEHTLVKTGIAIALPEGYEAQVRPRSGLALKSGITVLNSPGTIDADYRGEIGVILINLSQTPFIITRGMRIAQMVIAPYTRAEWLLAESLEESARGEGGFGSTGIHERPQNYEPRSVDRASPELSPIAERSSAKQGQKNKKAS